MGEMVLKVSTDRVGSTAETYLGYTKEEWEDLSDEEQNQWVQEMMWNVLDMWVEEEE